MNWVDRMLCMAFIVGGAALARAAYQGCGATGDSPPPPCPDENCQALVLEEPTPPTPVGYCVNFTVIAGAVTWGYAKEECETDCVCAGGVQFTATVSDAPGCNCSSFSANWNSPWGTGSSGTCTAFFMRGMLYEYCGNGGDECATATITDCNGKSKTRKYCLYCGCPD